jgi:SprT protein
MIDSKAKILAKYIPEKAAPIIAQWIDLYKCNFKISKQRGTRLGDYMPPQRGEGHKISVNYNLNPYSFLVTTVHEFAHLVTWNHHKNKVKPHGQEWKNNFKLMMSPFFELNVFPVDVNNAILNYLRNPAASSCSDVNLFNTLKQYNPKTEGLIAITEIAENDVFYLKNGRAFKKLNKIRTRFRCIELETNRHYLFSAVAEVYKVEKNLSA